MLRKMLFAVVAVLLPCLSFAQDPCTDCTWEDTVVINDDFINPADPVKVLTNDKAYVLVGHVFVEEGCELYIEPGTVIFGTQKNSVWAPALDTVGALVIARGGKIFACGSPNCPIIFTGIGDDLCDPNDLDCGVTQLWGGIIVLGNADINTEDSIGSIEGIPIGDTRARYGNANPVDDESSGVLAYISLRHGGSQLSDANEINGFTFGGVGSGTIIDHLEVFSNFDDGYEWFGGKVNAKYLVTTCVGDDSFDHDEGYRGFYQYIFSWYNETTGDKSGEHDGGTSPECGTPYAQPQYYNATYIHGGANACNDEQSTFHMRDNWSGSYYKSIFTQQPCYGIWDLENLDANYADPNFCDTEQRLRNGDLILENNYWYRPGYTTMEDYINPVPDKAGYLHNYAYFVDTAYDADGGSSATYYDNHTGPSNQFGIDPQLRGMNFTGVSDNSLDPRPSEGSPVASGHAGTSAIPDPYIDDVDYVGAFPPYYEDSTQRWPCHFWVAYWTHMYERGITVQQPLYLPGDANGDGNVNILDITYLIGYLYQQGPAPVPWFVNGDANNNGSTNILDITYMIAYLYQGGAHPIGKCCFQNIYYAYQEYMVAAGACPDDACRILALYDFIEEIKHYLDVFPWTQ